MRFSPMKTNKLGDGGRTGRGYYKISDGTIILFCILAHLIDFTDTMCTVKKLFHLLYRLL